MGCEIPLGYRVMSSVIFSVSKAETSIAAERIVLPEALNLSILLCSIHGQDTSITQWWLRIRNLILGELCIIDSVLHTRSHD